MFSNLEVESNIMEEQEFQNIISRRDVANDSSRVDTTIPQNTRITQNSNSQSNNNGCIGKGIITVNF